MSADNINNIKNKKAFTLVEVMVTVVILGILTAIAIPTYFGVTESSNRKIFETNHNIIVSGINMYVSAHNGIYPKDLKELTTGKYILLETGDYDAEELEKDTCELFKDEPQGATYKLTFSTTGITLESTYKGVTKTFSRGT